MMLFIKQQYGRSRPPTGGGAEPHRPATASRGTGHRADPGSDPGRRPGHQRRTLHRRRRPRRATSPTTWRRPPSSATDFERQVPGVPLVVVESPYRALVGPLLAYLDVLDAAWPPDKPSPITFVVIPEYVARSWWERILYNQAAKRLRTVLLGRPAHRRRRRPVSARGRRDVRVDARRGTRSRQGRSSGRERRDRLTR